MVCNKSISTLPKAEQWKGSRCMAVRAAKDNGRRSPLLIAKKKTVWAAVAVHLLLRTLCLEHPYKHIYVSIKMVYLPT